MHIVQVVIQSEFVLMQHELVEQWAHSAASTSSALPLPGPPTHRHTHRNTLLLTYVFIQSHMPPRLLTLAIEHGDVWTHTGACLYISHMHTHNSVSVPHCLLLHTSSVCCLSLAQFPFAKGTTADADGFRQICQRHTYTRRCKYATTPEIPCHQCILFPLTLTQEWMAIYADLHYDTCRLLDSRYTSLFSYSITANKYSRTQLETGKYKQFIQINYHLLTVILHYGK